MLQSLLALLERMRRGLRRIHDNALYLRPSFVWFCIFLHASGGVAVAFVHYRSFKLFNFDTGIYANQIMHWYHTSEYYSSILQRWALGEHFTPALLLLAPFLSIFESVVFIQALKNVAVSFTAVPLFLLASRLIKVGESENLLRKFLPSLVPLLWLCNPYVNRLINTEFQPSTLTLPLIAYCFLVVEKRFGGRFIAVATFLLAFKENLGFIWLALGSYLFVEKRQRLLGVVVFLFGIGSVLGIYLLLMPYLAAGIPNTHADRLSPFALPFQKVGMLVSALSSVFFLPLLSPASLVYIFPAFATSLLVKDPLMVTFSYHYHDIALPVLFVAVIHGVKKSLQYSLVQKWLCYLIPLLLIVSLINSGRMPWSRAYRDLPTDYEVVALSEIDELRHSLNTDLCELWTQDVLGPFFFSEVNLRSLIDETEVFASERKRIVLLMPKANSWPFSESDFHSLIEQFQNSSVFERRLGEELSEMQVFVSSSNCLLRKEKGEAA